VTAGYWVFIPPLRSQAAMERKVSELRDGGSTNTFRSDPGRWRNAISLGVFRSEQGATRYLAQLRQKGVRSATVGEREQRLTQTAFLISDPTEEESAKLAELKNGILWFRIARRRMPAVLKTKICLATENTPLTPSLSPHNQVERGRKCADPPCFRNPR